MMNRSAMPDELVPEANPAEQAYQDAKRFAREGNYAAALERHEWFHAHALAHEPAFYGVRLSFALSSWVELGQKHLPALESLKRIRDRDSDRLREGLSSDGVFRDVVAINRVLKQDEQTLMLFREIEAVSPETAQRFFRFITAQALHAAPDLFLRHTPDLMGHYEGMSQQHRELRRCLADSIARASSDLRAVKARANSLVKFDSDFLDSVQQLSQLARDAGQPETGSRMLTAAAAFIQELQCAKDVESSGQAGVDT